MNYSWTINIYEIQTILYWILGTLILHLGKFHILGWISIIYGWTVFLYIIVLAARYKTEIKIEREKTQRP